jgi:hypothetical protein
MKNKNNILHELDKIEGLTNQLNFIVNNQRPIEEYKEALERIRTSVDQTRLFVESEPQSYN